MLAAGSLVHRLLASDLLEERCTQPWLSADELVSCDLFNFVKLKLKCL